MIATLLIKLAGGTLAGIGGYIGKKHFGPKIVSLYKNAKNALLRGTDKGGSRKNR